MTNDEDLRIELSLIELDVQVESLLKEFFIDNENLKYRIMIMIIQSNLRMVNKNKEDLNEILDLIK